MQRPGLLQPPRRGFRLADRHLAGVPRERGGEQVGAGEHRLALGEMRYGPVHRAHGGRFGDGLRRLIAAR